MGGVREPADVHGPPGRARAGRAEGLLGAVEFTIGRGQIQLLNNREFGHYRSAFEDEPGVPRHLVRLWVRERGRRSYDG